MNKKDMFIWTILLSFLMVISVGLVSGADTWEVTLNTPAQGDPITGTYLFNATVTSDGNGNTNISNCTFSTTLDGLFYENNTANLSEYTGVFDTSSLTEIKQTTVTVNCYNNSEALVASDTATLVDIDNTNPVCSMAISKIKISSFDEIEIDCSRSTDTTDLTYNISIVDAVGAVHQSNSSDSIVEYNDEKTSSKGEYTAYCDVSDEVNKKNSCSSQIFFVKDDDDELTPTEEAKAEGGKGLPIWMWGGGTIIFLLLMSLAIWAIVKGSKKK